jgi:hypothetical protein
MLLHRSPPWDPRNLKGFLEWNVTHPEGEQEEQSVIKQTSIQSCLPNDQSSRRTEQKHKRIAFVYSLRFAMTMGIAPE